MGLTLLILSLAHERLWVRLPASPYFANAWMVLLSLAIIFAGALIAFAMVVAEFALIANTSALTFMVAGTFKEIVTGGWLGGCGCCILDACGCLLDACGCCGCRSWLV
jgi:solute carrier family 35 protein C2